jgi:uncharacterized membrane protein HdeD (DUF308 family)
MSPEWVITSGSAVTHGDRERHLPPGRPPMIVLGIILLVLGFVLNIPVLWTIGIILLVVGAVLAVLGAAGRAVGGRKHWY